MKLRIAQPGLRDTVQGGRGNDTAKRARRAEAAIVGHDEQNICRIFRRHNGRRPPRFGLIGIILDHAAELGIGPLELFPGNRCCGAGRPKRASDLDLLCLKRHDDCNERGNIETSKENTS